MSKRPTPNFKAATYVDIQKHWRRLGPLFRSESAYAIWKPCMREYMECRAGHIHNGKYKHQEEERHKWPSGYDGCDWRWGADGPLRGPHPAFWKFVCHGACHWLVDLGIYVAVTAWPKVEWQILSSNKHSTIWNRDYQKPVLFDANFLALKIEPEESLRLAWPGRRVPNKQFLKGYLR